MTYRRPWWIAWVTVYRIPRPPLIWGRMTAPWLRSAQAITDNQL